jgi:hypothetical protein
VALTRSRPLSCFRSRWPRVDSFHGIRAEVLGKIGRAPERIPVDVSTAESRCPWCRRGLHRPARPAVIGRLPDQRDL